VLSVSLWLGLGGCLIAESPPRGRGVVVVQHDNGRHVGQAEEHHDEHHDNGRHLGQSEEHHEENGNGHGHDEGHGHPH